MEFYEITADMSADFELNVPEDMTNFMTLNFKGVNIFWNPTVEWFGLDQPRNSDVKARRTGNIVEIEDSLGTVTHIQLGAQGFTVIDTVEAEAQSDDDDEESEPPLKRAKLMYKEELSTLYNEVSALKQTLDEKLDQLLCRIRGLDLSNGVTVGQEENVSIIKVQEQAEENEKGCANKADASISELPAKIGRWPEEKSKSESDAEDEESMGYNIDDLDEDDFFD